MAQVSVLVLLSSGRSDVTGGKLQVNKYNKIGGSSHQPKTFSNPPSWPGEAGNTVSTLEEDCPEIASSRDAELGLEPGCVTAVRRQRSRQP